MGGGVDTNRTHTAASPPLLCSSLRHSFFFSSQSRLTATHTHAQNHTMRRVNMQMTTATYSCTFTPSMVCGCCCVVVVPSPRRLSLAAASLLCSPLRLCSASPSSALHTAECESRARRVESSLYTLRDSVADATGEGEGGKEGEDGDE